MKALGVIPARGGSKRLPNKNIADLGGKPLFQWTIDAALESGVFSPGHLWVSTDSEEIGKYAGKYWWHRDPLLAKDHTPTIEVIRDVFEAYPEIDIVVCLQPTSPFRTSEDIRNAVALFSVTNADSVISTIDAPDDLAHQMGWANRLRTVPNIVTANGAFYGITAKALREGENFYSGNLYAYPMPKNRSIDIDHGYDLEVARIMVAEGIHLK